MARHAQWRCEHSSSFMRRSLSAVLWKGAPSAKSVLFGGDTDLAERRCASGQRWRWVALTHTTRRAALQPLHAQHRAMLGPCMEC